MTQNCCWTPEELGFYSTLVRLKDYAKEIRENEDRPFLFHIGTIKSVLHIQHEKRLLRLDVSIPHWYD